jgi:glycosyltransferase involved in cell wall biosynthesis
VSQNSSMYTDLAKEFSSNGYNVTVVVANGPKGASIAIEGGVLVIRIKTFELFNTSFIKKGLANVFLPFQISRGLRKIKDLKFDFIIVSTPPVTYLGTIKKLKTLFNFKVYLILRDIFPQNAKDLGIIKNQIVYNYFRKKEKDLYIISDHIGCMSPANILFVKNNNPEIDPEKLHLLPNWKNVEHYTKPDNSLKSKYNLDDKFIAIYGGNLGKPQNVETILDLALELTNMKDVIFLIIGEGSEKKWMRNAIAKKKLSNVLLMDPLPRDKFHELVKICDIGLVNLSNRFTIPNIPSRTLSYWEAKIPVLASIDSNTDFSNILELSGSGLWSITGDLVTYRKNFTALYNNKELRSRMGESGYRYLQQNCTTSIAFSIIHKKLIS